MKNILILGAGKSATVLIDYLLAHSVELNYTVTLGDLDEHLAQQKLKGHSSGKAVYFNSQDETIRTTHISAADIVVSLLPAFLHPIIAKDCVQLKKHFVSASYVGDEMQALHDAAVEAGIILLNEIGLDPGIDHMSAKKMIDEVKDKGGVITGFESYTGGLIAPESDNNPWNYKFTWNPRNVVLAGQGTAKFLQDHDYKYIPYHQLYSRYDILNVPGYGDFEGYPNRDSLAYRKIYGLENAATIVRGTLRKRGFCDAWNVFVQLGMTDDTYVMENAASFTKNMFTRAFLPADNNSTPDSLKSYLQITDQQIIDKINWLGLFEDTPVFNHDVSGKTFTPAQILQYLLEQKWSLEPGDKDMCVMHHVMNYTLHNQAFTMESSMVAIGTDEVYTAMAKTVGLPAAIATKMILTGDIKKTGVVIPVTPDIYLPVLNELETKFDIRFIETNF
jgi:saccharopine dehydrogenase-like NADP-dependent oxidoreductase